MAAAEIVGALVRANIAVAAAVLLVVIARRLTREQFGARIAYRLWLLPLVALLAVVGPDREMVVSAEEAARLASGSSGPSLDIGAPVIALWLTGVVCAAVVMAHLQRRFVEDARKGVIGPAVVGVIAPRVVTPRDFEQRFSAEEQALVLAHEQAHIARQDSRLNGLAAALQALFWFNPLVHLGAHLMRIDQELACDETVAVRFPDARRAYARALVKAQLAVRALPLGCYWPSRGEHPLLERVAMLSRGGFGPMRRWAGGSALAALCAGTWFFTWGVQPVQVTIDRPGVPRVHHVPSVPVMAPTGDMIPAVSPSMPWQKSFGAAPMMAPTGETMPSYTPPEE